MYQRPPFTENVIPPTMAAMTYPQPGTAEAPVLPLIVAPTFAGSAPHPGPTAITVSFFCSNGPMPGGVVGRIFNVNSDGSTSVLVDIYGHDPRFILDAPGGHVVEKLASPGLMIGVDISGFSSQAHESL